MFHELGNDKKSAIWPFINDKMNAIWPFINDKMNAILPYIYDKMNAILPFICDKVNAILPFTRDAWFVWLSLMPDDNRSMYVTVNVVGDASPISVFPVEDDRICLYLSE